MANPDLSEFEAHVRARGPQCSVKLARAELTREDQVKLDAAIAATYLPATALAKWFKDRGHIVSSTALLRHRRGDCNCAR